MVYQPAPAARPRMSATEIQRQADKLRETEKARRVASRKAQMLQLQKDNEWLKRHGRYGDSILQAAETMVGYPGKSLRELLSSSNRAAGRKRPSTRKNQRPDRRISPRSRIQMLEKSAAEELARETMDKSRQRAEKRRAAYRFTIPAGIEEQIRRHHNNNLRDVLRPTRYGWHHSD